MRARSLLTWAFAIALLIAAGGAAWLVVNAQGEEEEPQNRPARIVPVEVAPVNTRTLHRTVRGIGTLRPLQAVEIRPEVSGRLRAIHFREGALVNEGDLLFQINDEKLRRQLAAAEAALTSARARQQNTGITLRRTEEAHAHGGVTSLELDSARLEHEVALADVDRFEAEVEFVREQLQDTRLTAPFDGVISDRHVDTGAYVTEGQHLATIFNMSSLEMTFGVPERHMGRVHLGQRVNVSVGAFRDRVFEGEVTFVGPEVRAATRDFLVKATVPNPEGLLMPGASATAIVVVERLEDRPVVPEESLVATREGYVVFTVEGETAHRRPIRTGLRDAGWVEVTEGLDPGETVVRAGHLRLDDGATVRVMGSGAAESPPPMAGGPAGGQP